MILIAGVDTYSSLNIGRDFHQQLTVSALVWQTLGCGCGFDSQEQLEVLKAI